MREIKFRAKQKGWKEVKEFDVWVYSNGYYFDGINHWFMLSGKENGLGDCVANAKYELIDVETMGEFTRLKDKNGKEIYEGDIIECEYFSCLPTTKKIDLIWRGKVIWSDYSACFHVYRSDVEHFNYYAIGYSGSAIKKWEVIGNIYENPELIRDVK